VLERIEDAKAAQQEAEAELAVLVDHAVTLGIGWPEIATRLGVPDRRPAGTTSAVIATALRGRTELL
jgi:hypothetical protein